MFKNLLYISLILPFFVLSQHQIKGSFSPATEFKATMLYQLSAGNATYTSYATVNQQGEMQIMLDTSVSPGMYRLVYALPQSEHNFEFIYNGKEDIVFNFDATSGVEFINSEENQLLQSYEKSIIAAQNELLQLYAEASMDSEKYRQRVQKIDSLQNTYEALSTGTIAAHFIVANKPYIPSIVDTAKIYSVNAKMQFFEAINFEDTILQSSNFIIDKSIDYILKMHTSETPPIQDYKTNIDRVYQAFSTTEPSYQIASLNTLKDLLIASKHEVLAVYLTKMYVLPLANQLNDTELKASLETFLRVAVGAKAPNFDIEDPLTTLKSTLYNMDNASNYILIFWSSDCGHCLNELPKVHSYISKYPEKDIKVIAIGLEEGLEPWRETIKVWPKFTHAIAQGKWENSIPIQYDITATPSYFVLDASKVITSKPYLLKDLKAVLDQK